MTTFALQAIIFRETSGPAYALMEQMDGGNRGFVCLVKSLSDEKLYIRKQLATIPKDTPPEVSVVQHIPATCSTSRLISSHRCRRYHEDGNPVYDIHSLYFEFYNGGNLTTLLEQLFQKEQPIPEVFIWHFLARMTEIVAGLQLGWTKGTNLSVDQRRQNQSPICHGDLHGGNIFLNWPSNDALLPEIVLGDFGNASVVSNDDADGLKDLAEDIKDMGNQLIDLVDTYNINALSKDDGGSLLWERRFPKSYSKDLFTWCCRLSVRKPPSARKLVTDLLPVTEFHIARLLVAFRNDAQASASIRRTKPRLPANPMLLPERGRTTEMSTLTPLRKMHSHWLFHPMDVPEDAYHKICKVEAKMHREALAMGYKETSLVDSSRDPTHCKCFRKRHQTEK